MQRAYNLSPLEPTDTCSADLTPIVQMGTLRSTQPLDQQGAEQSRDDQAHKTHAAYRIVQVGTWWGAGGAADMPTPENKKIKDQRREQTYGYQGGKRGWDELGDWD